MRRTTRSLAWLVALAPALTVIPVGSAWADTGDVIRGQVVQVATEGAPGYDTEHGTGEEIAAARDADHVETFVKVGDDYLRVTDPRVTALPGQTAVTLRVADADAERLTVLSVQHSQLAAAAPTAPTTQTVDVVMAVPAGASQDTTPFSVAQVQTALRNASDYWNSQTGGKISFTLGRTQDWYQSTAACTTPNALWTEAADKVGFVQTAGRHLVVVVPYASMAHGGCGYGLGTLGGSVNDGGVSYVADVESSVWAHELGHNLSLGHANALYHPTVSDVAYVPGSGPNGQNGTYPGATPKEYGNVWDVMASSGSSIGHGNVNIAEQDVLGVLPRGVQTVSTTGTYEINALPNAGDGRIHGLKILDPATGTKYYVELRGDSSGDNLAASWSSGMTKGVMVTKADGSAYNASIVLDGSPTGQSGSDVAFNVPAGRPLTSASSQLSFTVQSANSSTARVKVSVANSAPTPGPVGAPSTVTASVGTADGTATVDWISANPNGGTISEYVVTPYLNGVPQTSLRRTVPGSTISAGITGLTPGETYTFTVTAKNEVDTNVSVASNSVVAVGGPAAVTGLTAVLQGTSAKVDWSAASNGGSPITGYVVTPSRGGIAQTPVTVTGVTATLPLDPDVDYTFSVAAQNARGTGTAVTSGTVRYASPGVPAQVTGVTAVDGGTPSAPLALLGWSAPNANNSTITDYLVTPVVDGTAQAAVSVGNVLSYQYPLTADHTYRFTVAAKNAQGSGAQSSATRLFDLTAAPDAPAVTATLTGSSVAVTWTAPAAHGSALTSYTVTPSDSSLAAETVAAGATLSKTYSLTSAGNYSFSVSATNGKGTSAAGVSNIVTYQAPVTVVTTPPVTTPPVVTPPVVPAPVKPTFDPSSADSRVGGRNRYDTASRIALREWKSADTVIVANGEQNGIDALSASYLAGVEDAPILLTGRDTVPAETLAAIASLNPKHVVVVGGVNSVSQQAYDALAAGRSAQRIAGTDRYDTAALLLAAGLEASSTRPTSAFLVRGDVYGSTVAADALAVSPVAFRAGMPVLLTGRDELPASTLAALKKAGITSIQVAGSSSAVSDAVTARLRANSSVSSVARLQGGDRTETAAAIARFALAADVGFSDASVGIANGYRIDALAAGPAAGKAGYPLLLTESADSLGGGTSGFLTDHRSTLSGATVFGDESAVSSKATGAAGAAGKA